MYNIKLCLVAKNTIANYQVNSPRFVAPRVRVRPFKKVFGAPVGCDRAHCADSGTPPHVGVILAGRLGSMPLKLKFIKN